MTAVINHPICPLHLRPSRRCELTDEALLGWTVDILDTPRSGWYHIRTDYGYTGYVPARALTVGDEAAARWAALEKKTVWKGICSVRSRPDVMAWEVTKLTRGAAIAVHGGADDKGWVKVSLPDGREGYTKETFLGDIFRDLDEAAFRTQVTAVAHLYMDSHYLWGGKTPVGIDCSGLTFMAYRLCGVTIWRDASVKEGYPLHAIDPKDAKAGDLLFFPGHVALYLGDSRYIHSTGHNGSDGVVINSFDPAAPDYRPDMPERLTGAGSLF